MEQADRHAAFPALFAYALALLALVLMILAQTFISIDEDKTSVLAAVHENQRLSLGILEEHAWRSLQDAVQVLNVTSFDLVHENRLDLNDARLLSKISQNEKQEHALLQTLSLYDDQGNFLAGSSSNTDGTRRFIFKTLKQLVDGEIVWGQAYPKLAQDGLVLPVAKIFKSAENGRLRVLLLELRLNYFNHFYSRLALGAGSHVSLHDAQGDILASFPALTSTKLSDLPTSLFSYRANNTSSEAYMEGNLAGQQDCLIAYRSLTQYPFAIILAQPKQSLLAAWQQRTLRKLILVALTLVLVIAMSYRLIRQYRRSRSSWLQLEAVDNRYKLLFDGAKDAILLISRDYTYIDCNPASLRVFGVADKHDIIGRRVGSFAVERQGVNNLPEQSSDGLAVELINRAFDGESLNFDWQLMNHGQISYCEVSLSPVNISGVAYLYAIIREVNDRRYSEKLLSGQNHILHLLSSNHNLSEILLEICAFVESFNPNWVCGIQILVKSLNI